MDILLQVAFSCLNIPYIYGGNHPLSGLDCSGLALWLLKSTGIELPDMNAQGLFDHFSKDGTWNQVQCGALVFFGKDAKHVSHVGMLIDSYRFIEAGGGDSTCVNLEVAKQKGAMVRISHLNHRKDRIAIIRPSYKFIGQI